MAHLLTVERAAWRRVIPLGVIVLLASGLIFALAMRITSRGGGEQPVLDAMALEAAPLAAAQPEAPAPPPHERPPTEVGPQALSDAYEACATGAGFLPGGVQVLVAGGTPVWVKSGRDVPAAVHRPCFRLIGGIDPHRSSWGTPSP